MSSPVEGLKAWLALETNMARAGGERVLFGGECFVSLDDLREVLRLAELAQVASARGGAGSGIDYEDLNDLNFQGRAIAAEARADAFLEALKVVCGASR